VIPSSCQTFDVVNQVCTTCNSGYFLQNGSCLQPLGSQNCQTWDFVNNVCGVCNSGYTLSLGLCSSPTPACSSGQVLVNNVCVYLPANCLALNSYYICTQCATNYQIVSGQCTLCTGSNYYFPCVTCPANYYIGNAGACIPASQYCLTSDPNSGLCLSCTSGATPVGGICCGIGQVVQNGVCSSASSGNTNNNSGNGGQITVGSSQFKIYTQYCLEYNFTLQLCTQCQSGHYFDYADHCA
jgi:hypothetical protein